MIKKYQRKIAILLIALLVFPMNIFSSIGTVFAEDGEEENAVVYEQDFEEGITDFIQSGNADLELAQEKEFEGNDNNKALHVNNRAEGANYHGADLLFETAELEDGYTYSAVVNGYVDADVEVPSGATVDLLTVEGYQTVGTASMVPGEAFSFTAEFTVGGEGVDRLRFQSNDAGIGIPFYIGEVVIEEVAAPEEVEPEEPGDEEPEEPEVPFEHEVIYEHDFEDGDTNGWYGRGPADVTVTDDGSGDNNALLASGRTDGWHGPGIDLTSLLEPGAQYEMEVSVKRVTAEDPSELIATVAVQPEDWIRVEAEDVSDTNWTVLNGTFTFTHDYTAAEFYVESSDISEDFYIDDVVITQLTPGTEPEEGEDPEDIPEDERVAIFTDFEDETTQGWEPRGDNEELSIADIGANDSSHSLLVENRLASSDAAIIEFLDSMHPGHEYAISLYLRLAEGEADTELQLSAAQTIDGETSYYPPIIAPETVTSGEWVKLEGTYAVPRNIEALEFYVEEVYDEDSTSGASYYIDDFLAEVTVSDNPVQTDLTPLKDIYDGEFYIGNALEAHLFNGRTGELLRHHHNLVTAENIMKPENYYVDGEFNPARPNQWLQNAVENNMLVHGHVLMWHSQSEDSLYQDADGNPLSAEVALANMREHIDNVMRSADEVAGDNIISWDVVNEALDGDWSNPEEWEGILRPASGWLQAIGPDYMYEAFLAARQVADELGRHDMVLYYNDYNDHVQAKARTMYHMVKDINERYAEEFPEDDRLLIGGVGMQAHYSTSVNIENIRESLERFITLGVEVGVTELDVGASETTTLTERENLEQAYFYAQLFDLYREHSDHINRVTFWGLSDNNSWRSENNPLLFDRNLQAKTAYYAVADPATYLAENEDPGVVVARQGNAAFGTPVMEGEIDGIWEFAPVLPINRFQTAHNGATGEARVLWDNENIYVLVEVNDTELDKSGSDAHEQDSVEVFIDEQNTKAASYGEGHGQFRVNFDNEQSFNPGPVEGFESRTFVDGTDYVVEMKIPFSTTTLEAGDMVGFDVQINDAFDGNRNSVAIWSDFNSGMGWSDPSVFGELTLEPVSPEYLQSIIDDLNERIDNLEGSNADLVQEVQELEETLQDALAGNEELRDLINSLLARLEALEGRVEELEDDTTTPGAEEPSDPEDPEGTDDSEDETETDDDSEATEDSETADGETLPKTATSIYNFLLIGALILIAGAGLALYSYKRRRA